MSGILAWTARWGFAVSVASAGLIGLAVCVGAAVPDEVPGVALRSVAVYRLEVGGAIFVGLYFVALAFVLALRNRAFTEIGTSGIKAETLGELPKSLATQERALQVLSARVDAIGESIDEREVW